MTSRINQEKLARIKSLDHGAHEPPNGEFAACVMEAVAYVAGEPWSDHPKCVCPVIGAFMRAWNDGLPDDERNKLLLPLVPRLIGTRGSGALAKRRSLMAADWLVRTHTPAWLKQAGLTDQAAALEALPEIASMEQVPSIKGPIEAARKDADAARNAAWDAAWDAVRDAVMDDAWAAARDATWAATRDAVRDAARDDVWDAAWAAVRDAAWDAARDANWDAARDATWAAVRDATWAAAWAAAWDATWATVRDAAWAAARGAAWNDAWAAARDTDWAAARVTAWDAAWAAARDAASKKLEPTRRNLQKSVLALVERMITCPEPSKT